jgi:glycosyltransferase involved in cell wall biosynthesis
MIDRPIISIIIPVYNSLYIEESIKSCVAQSIGREYLEIIIINDASTNETKEILSELSEKYAIKIIHLKNNSGPAAARNSGMESATGKFISFLDSDDMMKKDKLEKQLNYLSDKPDVDIVISGIDEVNQNGDFIRNLVRPFSVDKQKQIEIIFLDNLHTITSTLIFRREILESAGYMNSELLNLEDMDFAIKLINVGEIYYYPEGLTIRRVLSSGLSQSVSESLFLESRKIFYKSATTIFPFLKKMEDKYWSLNYGRLGRILQKRGLGDRARKFHMRSIKHKLNMIGLGGYLLSFSPNQLQKFIATQNWRKH